jgi:tetratricopeptide (TPR) repeat protein/CHAT domain-containing protein
MLCALALAAQAAAPPAELTKGQKSKLAQRDRLEKSLPDLVRKQQNDKAVETAERIATLEREVLGETDARVIASLQRLAAWREALGQYVKAIRVRKEVVRLLEMRLGKGHWQATDARFALQDRRRRAAMSPEDRAAFLQAQADSNRALRLYQQGRSREAVQIAVQVLAVCRQLLGERHPDYATSLSNLALLYKDLGEAGKALPLLKQALAITRELLGEKHPHYATSLHLLASLYQEMGDQRLALPLYQQALRLRQEVLGEKHPDYAASLNALALLYKDMGEHRLVFPLAQQALRLIKEVYGEKHPHYASSLNTLALHYQAMGEHHLALPLLQQALRLCKEVSGEKHPLYITALNNLAGHHQESGEHRLALPLYQQALRLRKEALGEKHPHYAASLRNLASIYQAMGERGQALPLLQRAVRLTREVQGERHPDYATSLNNLANLYVERGERGQALPLLQRAMRLTREVQGEKHPHHAASLNNLASLYQDLGEYRQALPLLQQALRLYREVLGPRHPDYANSLNNLADLYQDMGEHRQALPLFRRALQLRQEVLGERHPHYALSLNNLANLYQVMGEHRLALPLYQQALRLCKEVLGERHLLYASSLNNLASLYSEMGEHRQALPLSQQALQLTREVLGERHPAYALSLNNLARIYQAMGRPSAAAALAGQALAVEQAHLHDAFSALSDRQRRLALAQGESSLSSFLSVAVGLLPPPELYGWVARSKGALASRSAEERLARDEGDLQPLLLELRGVRAGLARLAGQVPPAAGVAAWRSRFDEMEGRKERLQAQLARKSAAFASLRKKPSARRIGEALPARTALVEFLAYDHFLRRDPRTGHWQVERRLLAFVLRGDRAAELVPLKAAAPVEAALRSWRLAVTSGAGNPRAEGARLLRARLWRPVEEHLGGIDTVLIAPDGALAQLPFAALPGRKAGSVLLEEYALGYLSGGRQLLDPPGKKHLSAGLLALGGPDFGLPRRREESSAWQALPGAEEETRRIEAIFRDRFASGPTRLLWGVGADRSRLLQALAAEKGKARWRYLHVATHGFFDPSRPGLHPAALGGWTVGAGSGAGLAGWASALAGTLLASDPGMADGARGFDPTGRSVRLVEGNPLVRTGLVLAGVNRLGHEATLMAEEVAGLDLRGTELAVLSACETGLGHLSGWQGVQGLPRAFHDAGVNNVLTSLWSVSDAATSVLMEQFYTQLWEKKQPPMQALRQAQLFVWKYPEQVEKRARELHKRLLARGISEEALAARGIGKKAREVPLTGGTARSSPVAWWAPWVLSGVPAR